MTCKYVPLLHAPDNAHMLKLHGCAIVCLLLYLEVWEDVHHGLLFVYDY